MKKLGLFFVIIFCLPLSGCMNSATARIVEDMYMAALNEDVDTALSYFSEDYLADKPIDELMTDLTADVINMKGIAFMNTIELNERKLNPELIKKLTDTYGDTWHFVVAKVDQDRIMTWVVQKGNDQYYIVGGEEVHVDKYNEEVLK
ncbi:hypothetical protein CWR48_06900 [Oceanobacillus arenosus]|uniref:DUF4878 domain-containing protein n=1 Tax=Oceanobacillus arenosus TaxID=1229153 RepID=A0A3D8PXZ3_9BACI|nr:hypothetical protein [Oceanobacillus arenosus]RDW20029.1 hypothetical protein CWR48_06900 [Oceanobacillus arenosus]